MWIYLIVAALVVLGIVGAVAGAGIFSLVLIPLALVALVASAMFSAAGRAAQGDAGQETDATQPAERPLPHRYERPSGRAPTTPEGLADARRAHQ